MQQPLAYAAMVIAGLTLVSSLTACGAHPTTPATKLRPPSTRPASLGSPTTAAPAGVTAAQLLAQVRQAQAATTGFTATVDTYDKGASGTESDTIAVAYKKPNTLHLNMVKATGQAQGATILWTGGDSLQIKLKVGFLPITTSLGLSDARIKSKNGWTLKQTEVNAIFNVLFDPQAQVQLVGQQPGADGRPLTLLQVRSAASPQPADHEVIGIDPQTGLPGMRMLFKGQDMIYRLTIKNLRAGAPSSTELAI